METNIKKYNISNISVSALAFKVDVDRNTRIFGMKVPSQVKNVNLHITNNNNTVPESESVIFLTFFILLPSRPIMKERFQNLLFLQVDFTGCTSRYTEKLFFELLDATGSRLTSGIFEECIFRNRVLTLMFDVPIDIKKDTVSLFAYYVGYYIRGIPY